MISAFWAQSSSFWKLSVLGDALAAPRWCRDTISSILVPPEGYAAGAIKAATADTIIRADLLTTLAIFGKLAYGQLDVISLIGRELMRESAILAEFGNEARVEEAQAAVLDVLEAHFGKPAASSC